MEEKTSKKYAYSKLDDEPGSFRLIELFPGDFTDDIRLRIFHANAADCAEPDRRLSLQQIEKSMPQGWKARESFRGHYIFCRKEKGAKFRRKHPDATYPAWKYKLEENPQDGRLRYEALSYTWGAPAKVQTALICLHHDPLPEPVREDAVIEIGENLAEALRYLRDEVKSRTLWIDAICINQGDTTEKTIQVRNMDAIYRRAHRVVVFLGSGDLSSRLALPTLKYLGEQVAYSGFGARRRCIGCTEKDWYRGEVDLGYDDQTWKTITDTLLRPWFTRLWIVQEVRLAGHRSVIQCGDDVIPLFLFRRAILCLQGKHWLPSLELRSHIDNTTQLFGLKDYAEPSLGQLLDQTRQRGCGDPRDKVFGILSLIPQEFSAKLSLAYSLPLDQFYRDTVIAHLHHTKRLELLHLCYQAGRNLSGPSWAPDLSSAIPVQLRTSSQFAAGCSRAHWSFTAPDLLSVLGIGAATVCKVGKPLELHSRDAVDVIRSWEPDDLMTGDYPPASMSLLEAHALTLRMNKVKERGRARTATRDWLEANANCGLWGDNKDPIPTNDRAKFAMSIRCCEGRAYIHTVEGHIGLAPLDTQPGDIIAVFLGCSDPVVLRPVREQKYKLIGQCFVLGLHDATSLLGPLPHPWRVQISIDRREPPRTRHFFVNSETKEKTLEDPRLEPNSSWVRLEHKGEVDEAEIVDWFQNTETEEIVNSDPRFLPAALLRCGVALRGFSLT